MTRPSVRLRLRLLVAFVIAVCVVLLVQHRWYPELLPFNPLVLSDARLVQNLIKNYHVFFDRLDDYKIDAPSIKGKYKVENQPAYEKFATDDSFAFTKSYLEGVLDIDKDTEEKMRNSHTRYVKNHMSRLLNDYGVSTFGANLPTDPDWSEYSGSRGYVLVGGGRFSWLLYLVIRQLRAVGAKYPIELFIPGLGEYEAKFCEELLPKLNARCNVFDDKLGDDLAKRFNIGGYQYKTLALLTLKFENLLYLDLDNFPVRNPDYLFDGEQYKKTGLVLWPDAWARTTNPKWYDIAGITVKENKLRYSKYDEAEAKRNNRPLGTLASFTFENSRFHDFEGALPDPLSETGQLLVNKTKHVKTLLLAFYYNVFGPHFYYPIMTQGLAGEGDKELFIAAAHALGLPYYQTRKGFWWIGYVREDKDDKFDLKALGHFDPDDSAPEKNDDARLVFMHLLYPKFYPLWLYDNHELVLKKSGKQLRMYESVNEKLGYDFDLRVLQFFTMGMCKDYFDGDGKPVDGTAGIDSGEYMGDYLEYVKFCEKGLKDQCEKVFLPHLKWLKETTKYPETSVVFKKE